MKVYIAGPMRGYPNFNFPAFHAAQAALERGDHEVFNPAARDEEQYGSSMFFGTDGEQTELDAEGFNLREALHADTEFITRHAEAVCVLDGWEESKGATAEVALARALGLPVYTLAEIEFQEIQPNPVIETGWQPVIDRQDDEQLVPTGRTLDILAEESEEPVAVVPEYEIRTVSESGAMKGVKPARFDLIPVKALTEVAKHYGRTAQKYPPNNWRKGFEWSKSYAALLRHLTQWWDGEELDVDAAWPEGSPHLAAVAWHALTLLEYKITNTGVDDRPE